MSCRKIGIDKLVLYNFFIQKINPELLYELDNVEVKETKNYTEVVVKDKSFFDRLMITYSPAKDPYVSLSLSVYNSDGTNLIPMSFDEYNTYLECVINYIEEKYSISLDWADVKVSQIEINTNIELTHPFSEYKRAIGFLMKSLPKSFGKAFEVSKQSNNAMLAESIYRSNKSVEIVYYNKTRQLRDSEKYCETKNEIMRIELKLKRAQSVISHVGTNKWQELNNNLIEKAFQKWYKKNVIVPYEKWVDESSDDIRKEYLSGPFKNAKQILFMLNKYRNTECVQKKLTVLDIEQVLAAIKDIPQIKKNYKRICDAVKEYESLIPDNIFANNDTSKIDEIFNAVINNDHHSDDNSSSEFEERKT